jgi:LmbE family N-acetylglucosaminyl deacetylase
MNRSIMAVGAHADDHELQAGGSLAKYYDLGYEIIYVMATNNMSGSWCKKMEDGSIVETNPPHDVIRPQRIREAEAAACSLGTKPIFLDHPQRHYRRSDGIQEKVRYGCELPTGVPPNVPTILTAYEDTPSVDRVVDLILDKDPEAILTHGMPMANIEHFGTCLLVTHAYRQAVERGYNGMLLYWHDLGVHLYGEAYSGWDTFVNISAYWERKIELSAFHACQKPNPEALDWPPYGPACGCRHAEVFTIAGRTRVANQYQDFTLEILNNER